MASLSCDAPATTSWHFDAVEVGPSAPSSAEADSIRRDRSIPACPPWRGRYPGIWTINATALAAAPAEIAGASEPGRTRLSRGADDFAGFGIGGCGDLIGRSRVEHARRSSESKFGKSQPQKWTGFTPPRSRIMPPLSGLLLLRRVQTTEQNWPSGRRKTRQPATRCAPH
jgi:hypothetical protein